jgi:predicted site-specific integrase-resolvase
MEGPLTPKILKVPVSLAEEEPIPLLAKPAQQGRWVQGDRFIPSQERMRVAVYARVAGPENAQEEIERQIRQAREQAAHYGWDVAGVYRDVGSGLEWRRPGLKWPCGRR